MHKGIQSNAYGDRAGADLEAQSSQLCQHLSALKLCSSSGIELGSVRRWPYTGSFLAGRSSSREVGRWYPFKASDICMRSYVCSCQRSN